MNNQAEVTLRIKTLLARNLEITKAGGFFTPEQVANGNEAWKLKMRLRFEFNDKNWNIFA